ncbi:MAG: histidine kinase [Actinomycetota bacterium]|nr:histidine kinase [Actinomycetota bacterium]
MTRAGSAAGAVSPTMLTRALSAWPNARWGAMAVLALAALAVVALWWPGTAGGLSLWQVAALVQGLAWCAVAEAARRSALPGAGAWMRPLLLATGVCLLVASLALPAGLSLSRFSDLAWLALAVALVLALTSYPTGQPAAAGWLAAGLVLLLGLVGVDPTDLFRSPELDTGSLRGWLGCALVAVLFGSWWWRGERADAETRVVLLWPVLGTFGSGLLLGHLVFVGEATGLAEPAFVPAIVLSLLAPASVAVGLVAPGGYDVRRLISGFVVSVVMVDLTIGIVAGSLAGWTIVTGSPPNKGTVAVLATACAAAFGPVLVRVRRTIEEVLFGGSSDPLEAMSRLGAELGADSSPNGWVAALRSALVVPRVELRIAGALLAAAGEGTGVSKKTALRAGGEHVGDLIVTLPNQATRLPRSTRAVLDLVAAPLARALQAVRLADELHASRGRVVQAREEERRRLRRDLHDGLGPLLTGVAYTADATANVLLSDADRATALLGQLREDTTGAIAEIRRIVQGLRPPALDEVGLAGALRQHALRYDGIQVDVHCAEPAADAPGRLPAAAEVVAYRVAVEALTNAVRHARPRGDQPVHVTIGVASSDAADELVVTVQDNGGSPGPWTTGTGLASILARCDEVGGDAAAGPTPAGGRVVARLPLRPA